MATKIELANRALVRIGADTVTSLTDGKQQARDIETIFDSSLAALLQEQAWSFATKRAALALSAETPLYEFAYAYPLPADFLKLQHVQYQEKITPDQGVSDYDYTVEDYMILSDLATCNITYTALITDMNKLSHMFQMALVYFIANEVAFTLTTTPQLQQQLMAQYAYYMTAAKVNDARQDKRVSSKTGSWIRSR